MQELAGAFGTTAPRRLLLRNLIAYRELLANEGYVSGIQFIDGSFMEDVETFASRAPSDIDVFSVLNIPPKYHAAPATWPTAGFPFWRIEVIDRDRNKRRFGLDTYAVLFEDLHAQPMALIRDIIYWYSLFSHQRGTLAWKGFAGLTLDPAGDQAALSALGSA